MPGAVVAFFNPDANRVHGQAVFIHLKKRIAVRPADPHPGRFFIKRFVIGHLYNEPAVRRGLYIYFFAESGPGSEIGRNGSDEGKKTNQSDYPEAAKNIAEIISSPPYADDAADQPGEQTHYRQNQKEQDGSPGEYILPEAVQEIIL